MILLWGLMDERPMSAVADALQRLGSPFICLDQRHVLDTEVELCIDTGMRGTLRTRHQVVDLCAITAVYLRTYDWRHFPDLESAGPDSPAWRYALGVEEAIQTWLELTPALVVNPMMAMATNSSKPYQAIRIQSHGFAIPDTLMTTDPDAAREFWEQHGTVIYKSISSIRSIVSRLTPAHLDRLQDVVWCPTQFQQYIPGHDYRVHVVGDEIFACEIITQGDDYRYAGQQGASVAFRPYHLPAAWADRCRALALDLELPVAGIDLRRTPEGQWYCFEVNPSPAFTFYQAATGQPIDEAIARFLGEGPRRLSQTPAEIASGVCPIGT
jgi:hypothetical protein